MPRATSPTSTATSFRSATRSSIGRKPVDGSDPATEWQGLLTLEESPHLLNPASGWLYNTNNCAVVGGGSEQPEGDRTSRSTSRTAVRIARGLHAIRVLTNKKDFSLDELVKQRRTTATCRRSRR